MNLKTTSLILFLAQGFGAGRAPKAPGTFGTLPGVGLYLILADIPLGWYLAITAILFLVGIAICGNAAQILGRADPPSVVWDEIVGYLVTMIAVPVSWPAVIASFALFRLFDIWKPWPIGFVDRHIHGGLGIMLDDVIAGLFASALLHLFIRFIA